VVPSLRGQLLIAAPTLLDPNFSRTVVLICEHGDEGALGLVLNRRTELEVAAAVPELHELIDGDDHLWSGGPVQPSSIVLLAEFDDPGEALMVTGDVGLVLEGTDMDSLGDTTRRARAFVGYSGWGAGQLEAEVEADDWIIAPSDPEDAFTDEPGDLWRRVLERKGGRYALLATMPPDPSLN
jgi:putative transcriptional regulator